LQRIVSQIRGKWPKVKIVLRGDSGFCREEIMAWCETNGVDYVGLAKNNVVIGEIEKELKKAEEIPEDRKAARYFKDFQYSTKEVGAANGESSASRALEKGIESTIYRHLAFTENGRALHL
jgi:hypothetical protein